MQERLTPEQEAQVRGLDRAFESLKSKSRSSGFPSGSDRHPALARHRGPR